jgi:predicted amidophosphoribosyltransferase
MMERCPACAQLKKKPGQYLCPDCWYELPPITRTRLNERGDKLKASERYFQLLSAIRRNVELCEIQVAA